MINNAAAALPEAAGVAPAAVVADEAAEAKAAEAVVGAESWSAQEEIALLEMVANVRWRALGDGSGMSLACKR